MPPTLTLPHGGRGFCASHARRTGRGSSFGSDECHQITRRHGEETNPLKEPTNDDRDHSPT